MVTEREREKARKFENALTDFVAEVGYVAHRKLTIARERLKLPNSGPN